jgi:hypothetical protein
MGVGRGCPALIDIFDAIGKMQTKNIYMVLPG